MQVHSMFWEGVNVAFNKGKSCLTNLLEFFEVFEDKRDPSSSSNLRFSKIFWKGHSLKALKKLVNFLKKLVMGLEDDPFVH